MGPLNFDHNKWLKTLINYHNYIKRLSLYYSLIYLDECIELTCKSSHLVNNSTPCVVNDSHILEPAMFAPDPSGRKAVDHRIEKTVSNERLQSCPEKFEKPKTMLLFGKNILIQLKFPTISFPFKHTQHKHKHTHLYLSAIAPEMMEVANEDIAEL